MNLLKNWKPVIDRFHAKLSSWKANILSFGGRLTLVMVVFGSLFTCYLSLFNAPIGVIESLEKIRKNSYGVLLRRRKKIIGFLGIRSLFRRIKVGVEWDQFMILVLASLSNGGGA